MAMRRRLAVVALAALYCCCLIHHASSAAADASFAPGKPPGSSDPFFYKKKTYVHFVPQFWRFLFLVHLWHRIEGQAGYQSSSAFVRCRRSGGGLIWYLHQISEFRFSSNKCLGSVMVIWWINVMCSVLWSGPVNIFRTLCRILFTLSVSSASFARCSSDMILWSFRPPSWSERRRRPAMAAAPAPAPARGWTCN